MSWTRFKLTTILILVCVDRTREYSGGISLWNQRDLTMVSAQRECNCYKGFWDFAIMYFVWTKGLRDRKKKKRQPNKWILKAWGEFGSQWSNLKRQKMFEMRPPPKKQISRRQWSIMYQWQKIELSTRNSCMLERVYWRLTSQCSHPSESNHLKPKFSYPIWLGYPRISWVDPSWVNHIFP